MLAQAAGTGASAGAAAVSESDMSVVLKVRVLSSERLRIPKQRDTERVRRIESKLVKGAGAPEEVGGDKHVSGQHMYVHSRQGGRRHKGEGAVTYTAVQRSRLGPQGQKSGSGELRFLTDDRFIMYCPRYQMGLLPSARLSRSLYDMTAIWVTDH